MNRVRCRYLKSAARRIGCAVAAMCLLGVYSLRSEAPLQAGRPTEYQLKAADLVAFGRFVEWPQRPRTPDETFDLCVLGQDPFGPALDVAARGEDIGGIPAAVKRIARPHDALACRVLFIASSEESQLDSIFGALGSSPVLTVSDIPRFIRRGGMIEFYLEESRVRFEVNLAVAKSAGLNMSSELLKLARVVRRSR